MWALLRSPLHTAVCPSIAESSPHPKPGSQPNGKAQGERGFDSTRAFNKVL
ncbi:hypothetical protein [[Phormidium] sp. ETS-05]|uniref:hypothetical protein n=1 Tax=[Phormidium] sp. ETS-05 TaxID=222819 RepID=UPI0018EED769|nr:hypothetical protein [[Phormidium] sp. ETS-05]